MRHITRRSTFWLVLVAATAIIGGAAYAAVPGPDGTISACADGNGRLRVIDAEAGTTCKTSERPLAWNQQGPAGPQGSPGISGYELVEAVSANDSSSPKQVFADCPAGKRAIGGGARAFHEGLKGEFPLKELTIAASNPTVDGSAWQAVALEAVPAEDAWTLRSYAICANVN
jgi:hypothetical protein